MYVVRVSDHSHYLDDSELGTLAEFHTWAEAVCAACGVVDRSLQALVISGQSADELFARYSAFGDDPWIAPIPDGEHFSAWDYARAQCAVYAKT